ncbi:DNA replication and repair protein RecF [Metallosphaera sp. J1]|uniref:AAA family ATPase n=1 Tax=Metallosphaera javensis (ex Hofmann et al. 2022) TaxID=99938 RepID=UPI001EDF535F|nr:AAA family ATPase [Metallosphaera javensis (ex Hofmann et al. 2022)]MCG3109002.1 DNA replication and repair protein RecF [Metallosphaera javensis (ex Hofmann et al. 2022)]
MIKSISIDGFRGLKFNDKVSRVNLIIGENSSGKTSFLEAIFFSTLLLSNRVMMSDANSQLIYMFNSRGEALSSFATIGDSLIHIDNNEIKIKRVSPLELSVLLDNREIAKITVERISFSHNEGSGAVLIPTLSVKDTRGTSDYFPVYISVYFDNFDNPERIISYSKKAGGKSQFEILKDDYDQFKLFYSSLPVYSVGRGFLKKELIRASLSYANILLVDEIEDSLHPDYVRDVLKSLLDAREVQSFIVTHSNEVIKMASRLASDSSDIAIYYFNRERKYAKYSLTDLSSFDSPLSWAGYIW